MKKNKIIAASAVGAIAVLGMGAFAFFSDETDQDVEGTVGTVDVNDDLNLSLGNKENFNPGDENTPYDPENPGNTTPHELSFDVTNDGTKSIRTRNIIEIVVKKAGTDPVEYLDPTAFRVYEKSTEAPYANTEVSDLTDLAVSKGTYTNSQGATVLQYIVEGASLNGAAGHLEDEDITAADDERDSVTVNDAVTSATYKYYLGLDSDTLDEYQGATIEIKLTVQAMQYRNTNGTDTDGNWVDVLTDTVVAGTPVTD